MNDFYTYAYLREDLSPYYIGKGRGNRMFSTHRHIAKPKDNHRIAMLRGNMSEEQALKHECEIIKFFGRKDLGTGLLRNMTDGGEGTSGHKHTEEYKEKRRDLRLDFRHTEESKARMSLARIGRIGRKHTEESKAKISLVQRGKELSEEHKAKLSLAMMGNTNGYKKKLGTYLQIGKLTTRFPNVSPK